MSSGCVEPTPDRIHERAIGLHALGAESSLEIADQPPAKGGVLGRPADEVIETASGKR